MQFKIDRRPWHEAKASWLVVGVSQDESLPKNIADFDKVLHGKIARIVERGDFEGKCGEQLAVLDVPDIAAERLLLIGLGKSSEMTIGSFERAMRTAARTVSAKKGRTVALALPKATSSAIDVQRAAQTIATAFIVGSAGQDLYKGSPDHHPLATVTLLIADKSQQKALEAGIDRGTIL